MTFRPLHTDGSKGDSRSIQMDNSWRAEIGGRSYRASDLMRGQQLNVYIPQDRFALAVVDDDGPDEEDIIVIEEDARMSMDQVTSALQLTGYGVPQEDLDVWLPWVALASNPELTPGPPDTLSVASSSHFGLSIPQTRICRHPFYWVSRSFHLGFHAEMVHFDP